jgi:hypothetical protein
LGVFFVLTLLMLGPVELVGHAPLFGIVFLFVSRGAGAYVLIPARQPSEVPASRPRPAVMASTPL